MPTARNSSPSPPPPGALANLPTDTDHDDQDHPSSSSETTALLTPAAKRTLGSKATTKNGKRYDGAGRHDDGTEEHPEGTRMTPTIESIAAVDREVGRKQQVSKMRSSCAANTSQI